jgi:hypothetical protein
MSDLHIVAHGLPHPENRRSGSAESVFRVTFPTTNDGSVSNRLQRDRLDVCHKRRLFRCWHRGTQEGEYDEAEIFMELPIVMILKLEIENDAGV